MCISSSYLRISFFCTYFLYGCNFFSLGFVVYKSVVRDWLCCIVCMYVHKYECVSSTGSGIVCECSRHSPRVPGYLCMRDAFEMLLSILWMDVVVDYYVQQHIGSFGYHPSTSLLE